jgi:hypothetical protein
MLRHIVSLSKTIQRRTINLLVPCLASQERLAFRSVSLDERVLFRDFSNGSCSLNFISTPDEDTSDAIMTICKQLEERDVRAKRLYSEYMSNIKFSHERLFSQFERIGNNIILKDLAARYDITSQDVLSSLYFCGHRKTEFRPSNIFGLPKVSLLMSLVSTSTDLPGNIKMALTECLKSASYTDHCYEGMHKTYYTDDMKVIVQKDNVYDVANLETIIEYSTEDTIVNKLYETKYIDRSLSYDDIGKILSIASKTNNYIEQIGATAIKNTFINDHIYNIIPYDMIHGKYAFHEAILAYIAHRVKFHGADSIKYNATNKLIWDCAKDIGGPFTISIIKTYQEFIDLTDHFHNDTYIEIGRLMDTYSITSQELLNILCNTHDLTVDEKYTTYLSINTNSININSINTNSINKEKITTIPLEISESLLINNNYRLEKVTEIPYYVRNNRYRKHPGERQFIDVNMFDNNTSKGRFYCCIMKRMLLKNKQ